MEGDEDQFYDTREELCSVSDSDGFSEPDESSSCDGHFTRYQDWTNNNLESVRQRRLNFLRWMGLEADCDVNSMVEEDELVHPSCGVDRVTSTSGAVLRTSGVVEGSLPSTSSQIVLDSLSNEASSSLENCGVDENLACMIKNLDDGTQYIVDKLGQDGTPHTLRVLGSNQLISLEEFQRPSPLVRRYLQRGAENTMFLSVRKKKMKKGWLRKLACVVHDHGLHEMNSKNFDSADGSGIHRVRVHSHRKRLKELSSVYTEQEFEAHKGIILTMKFSLDGKYLASGGEDGIVRVWEVVENVRSSELDMLDNDPSSIYFKMNNFSCVAPLDVDKEKLVKTEKSRKSSDSTCVIIPPKTFRILGKPLHEFQGHSGDILDLAWSKRGLLLSSSVDKTVRLWQVGVDRCLRVFSHNNYVTCVHFNPINDNIFISGSIDGKVRIWEVLCCRVIDYIDIREIVTAVCFRPDGKGTIVGTMAGNCRFYDIIDDHMQLDTQLSLRGKKKTAGKRITGFQFSPIDTSQLLVASADSHVCILSGVDVIYKFRGLRSAGQMHASFTSDGKHIISVSEDSNVCVWNYTGHDRSTSKAKKIWSSECFLSHNAAIAVPWCGMESVPGTTLLSPSLREDFNHKSFLSSPDCFFLSRGFLSELVPKVSPTWPEEALLDSPQTLVSPKMCKSEYKFLRSACKGMSYSHLWGQVIVTAGWDGHIRVYQNYGLPVRV